MWKRNVPTLFTHARLFLFSLFILNGITEKMEKRNGDSEPNVNNF